MAEFLQHHRELSAQAIRDFIADRPDEPLLEEYPYPAREFQIHSHRGKIAIYHPSLPLIFVD